MTASDETLVHDAPAAVAGSVAAGSVAAVVVASDVIVCCGSGGVGKTTTAAVLGLDAARAGRRVVVVTIDPARRLADALGLVDGLSSQPQRVDDATAVTTRTAVTRTATATATTGGGDGDGAEGGQMWAMMLDTAATFDGLVRAHADDDDQVERILSNPFYRNMAGAMSGTQEYMAAETLHALHLDERFDLVIVDTPPSRNALDFLDAPGVLSRFLDHKIFRLAMLPTRGGLKFLGTAAQPVFKAIGKIVGSDVLTDSLAFFQAFAGMESGFRDRADEVIALLRDERTSFIVIASPRDDTITEAVWFARQLRNQDVPVAASIVNRIHPDFARGVTMSEIDGTDSPDSADAPDSAIGALRRNLVELDTIRAAELEALRPLVELTAPAPVALLPLLAHDVHDIEGLDLIAEHLFAD